METCLYDFSFKKSEFENCDRIYIGEEACDTFFINKYLIIEKSISILNEINKPTTLVLPVINEVNFERILNFVLLLKKKFNCIDEIVCNDIGTMNKLKGIGLKIGAGRIFCRSNIYNLKNLKELEIFDWIEVDFLNIKHLDELLEFDISLYTNNVVYGFSNDRCPYYRKFGDKVSRKDCKCFCEKRILKMDNKYTDIKFYFYHNFILSNIKNTKFPNTVKRIIKAKG